MEIEPIRKSQAEEIIEVKILGIQTGTTKSRISNETQELEGRISGVEDMIEEMDTLVKENVKSKDILTPQKIIQEISEVMKRTYLRILRIY
jgi:fibrillarin-like rRNA methylase